MELSKAGIAVIAAVSVTAGTAIGYLATRGEDPTTVEASAAADSPADLEDVAALAPLAVEGGEPSADVVTAPPARPAVAPAPPPAPRPARQAPRPPAPVAAQRPDLPLEQAPARQDIFEVESEIVPIVPATIDSSPPEFHLAAPIPPAPPALEFQELELATDSVIGLQMESLVSSEMAEVEDEVVARVTRDVKVGSHVAIPAGSTVRGEVTLVERGGKVRERARLGVRFTSIVLADGTRVPVVTETIYREGEAPGRESATKIGGGAIGGAIIGGILGGSKGAAIGGSIGAGAGSAAVLAGGRNPATLSAGAPVTIRLQEPALVVIEK